MAWQRTFQIELLQSTLDQRGGLAAPCRIEFSANEIGASGQAWQQFFRVDVLQCNLGPEGRPRSEPFAWNFCKVIWGQWGGLAATFSDM